MTLGFQLDPQGQPYLSCGATHLTAFAASFGALGVQVSVNIVHPIDDAGMIRVPPARSPSLSVHLSFSRWLRASG